MGGEERVEHTWNKYKHFSSCASYRIINDNNTNKVILIKFSPKLSDMLTV